MRVLVVAVLLQGEGLGNVVHRHGTHQSYAGVALGGGVGGGDPHKDDAVSLGVLPHGHFFLAGGEGIHEGAWVGDGQVGAVEHFKIILSGVKAQVLEIQGFGVGGQKGLLLRVLMDPVRGHDAGQGLHLLQVQVDGGLEVEGELLAHAGHIEGAHLVDGPGADAAHMEGQKGKDAHA